jgi:NitT/TauT family transport system ATP-binding protein
VAAEPAAVASAPAARAAAGPGTNLAQRGPAAAVELRSLTKVFRRGGRRTVAFSDVGLTIAAGEFVCLLGPSGCGKSTLLRVVAGMLSADEGSVTVAGQRVTGPGADRGMLFQRPMLFPWLTTRDNVLFGPRAQRSRGLDERNDAELRADADAILETVGLTEFAEAYPHELSGGMQHRAAFARAVITRPSVLLMDEPFGALDAITRLRMQQFLLEMWERYRITILFVTHDIEEAILLGDRVALMGGRPPGLHQLIDVPLERPRVAESVDDAAVLTTKRHIRSVLTHATPDPERHRT